MMDEVQTVHVSEPYPSMCVYAPPAENAQPNIPPLEVGSSPSRGLALVQEGGHAPGVSCMIRAYVS